MVSDRRRLPALEKAGLTLSAFFLGPKYEESRVRHNYPRCKGDELATHQAQIKDDDDTFRRFCREATPRQIHHVVRFLEEFANEAARRSHITIPPLVLERALFVTIMCLQRVQKCNQLFAELDGDDDVSICTNGQDLLAPAETIAKAVFLALQARFDTDAQKAMFRNDTFRLYLEKAFDTTLAVEFVERLAVMRDVFAAEAK
jgi:hypothetical protein